MGSELTDCTRELKAARERLAEAETLLRDVREYGCLIGSEQWSEVQAFLRASDVTGESPEK